MQRDECMRVLLVSANPEDREFAANVLGDRGDIAETFADPSAALTRLVDGGMDVVVVSLALARGDGLALVHHLRALHPLLDVICIAGPTELEDASHAMALGVLQTVMRPLTGDSLLLAVDRARERRLLLQQRQSLGDEAKRNKERSSTYARCASFVSETDLHTVIDRVLQACASECSTERAGLFVPSGSGVSLHSLYPVTDKASTFPTDNILVGLDPSRPVDRHGSFTRVAFLGPTELHGVALIESSEAPSAHQLDALHIVAALGTAAMSSAKAIDLIARSGLKDPDTSAYSFAYFGDVAGREIARATRHGRRFALMTLTIDGLTLPTAPASVFRHARGLIVDAVLSAMRDGDVLARVDDDDFFLLLPETGLLGALATRRRIATRFQHLTDLRDLVRKYSADAEPDLTQGIAVFPQDGSDLGRLLRVARESAERSRSASFRSMGFENLDFARGVRALLARASSRGEMCTIPITVLPRLATNIVRDAVTHRAAGVVYVAGDAQMTDAVLAAVENHEPSTVRAWALDPTGRPGRGRLTVHSDLQNKILLLSLTAVGGYALVGTVNDGQVSIFHGTDIDLVDGLVTSLQRTYHLQPELG